MSTEWSSIHTAGMENPVTTYVTPTLLAGDRSLDRVICHEVALLCDFKAANDACSALHLRPCHAQNNSALCVIVELPLCSIELTDW
jgi:hypothetical protein